MDLKIGSLLSPEDREYAADLIQLGEIVAVYNRGVCALWFDGGNKKAIDKVVNIKGEGRQTKPISLTMSLEEFVPMIDFDLLPDNIKSVFLDQNIKHRIGSLCFIRAPLKADYNHIVPEQAKSYSENGVCMIQNWDSFGHNATELFLEAVKRRGVQHPGITSMNKHGEPEIIDQNLGEKFCQESGIKCYLKDPHANPKHIGSYTILSISQNGITLERDGNIPGQLFEYIFDLPINSQNSKPAKHPQLEFPEKLLKSLPPDKIRQAILMFVAGQSVEQIKQSLGL